MSFFSRLCRSCCGGEPEPDDQAIPMTSSNSLNMVVEGNGGGGSASGGDGFSTLNMLAYNGSGGSPDVSAAYSVSDPTKDSSSSSSYAGGSPTGRKRRGVSFAPDGFTLPPSPELKTSEITSPRTRARSIIKQSSFRGDPRDGAGNSSINNYSMSGSSGYYAGGGAQQQQHSSSNNGSMVNNNSYANNNHNGKHAGATNASLVGSEQGLSSAILRDDLL